MARLRDVPARLLAMLLPYRGAHHKTRTPPIKSGMFKGIRLTLITTTRYGKARARILDWACNLQGWRCYTGSIVVLDDKGRYSRLYDE